jgi:limonene-1,2-epoxide hydrolase
MSDSPETVVRQFFAAWENPKLDELARFFSDDAVWIDGPNGTHRGKDAISSELKRQLAMGYVMLGMDVKSLVADAGTVMMERVDRFSIGGKPFSMEFMAAFEIDADARIKRWRDSFDLKSIRDQIEASRVKGAWAKRHPIVLSGDAVAGEGSGGVTAFALTAHPERPAEYRFKRFRQHGVVLYPSN